MFARATRYLIEISAVAAVYFGAHQLGLLLARRGEDALVFWPATGVGLAAMLHFGYRAWPGIALGALLAGAWGRAPLAVTVAVAAGNSLEAVASAYLLRRLVGFRNDLRRIRDILGLAGVGALAGTAVGATVGVAALWLGHLVAAASWERTWLYWWLGNAVSVLAVTPVLLAWADGPPPTWRPLRAAEATAVTLALALICLLTFGGWIANDVTRGPLFSLFPLVIWMAERFDQRGTTVGAVLIAAASVWGTARGYGPFVHGAPDEGLMDLPPTIAVLMFNGLFLAAAFSQRRRAEEALRARERRLHALAELGSRALTAPGATAVIEAAPALVAEALHVECAQVLQQLPDRKAFLVRAGWGWPQGYVGRVIEDPDGKSLLTYTLRSEGRGVVDDLAGDVPFPGRELLREQGLAVCVSVLIHFPGRNGRPFGILAACTRRRQDFDPDQVRFLQTTADLLAMTVERQRAEERRQEAAARLARSNRELQDFAAVASHDLQEPLRKIQTFADRLRAGAGDRLDQENREDLDSILRASGRMRNLIDGLLTFARVTTRARPFVAVDLAEVAHGVVSDLEARVQRGGGRVEVGDLPTLDAEPLQMRQLLLNLIGNALKFQRPGVAPVVRVYATPLDAAHVRLFVEDNGIGFDEAHLDRIFEVFQRLHGRGEYEGTGMGLAICRKIVDRHGGTITARSKPGEGATFIVLLPTTQPRAEVAARAPPLG